MSDCQHLRTSNDREAWLTAHAIDSDLETLRKAPSKKIGKKCIARVQKCVASYVKKWGQANEIYAAFLGKATVNVLEGEISFARATCLNALHFAVMFSLLSELDMESTTNQILTGGGLTCFLAKTIPCNCLASKTDMNFSSNNACLHGGGDKRALKAITLIDADCTFSEEESNRLVASLKNAVPEEDFAGCSADEVSSILHAECFSLATRCILEEESWSRDEALHYLVCKLGGVFDFGSERLVKSFVKVEISEQLRTDAGLIVYLAKQIPCNCLDSKKQEAKKTVKTGICDGCTQELPCTELFQCSRCKVASYCSESCQLKDWKVHKIWCPEYEQQKKEAEEEAKAKGREDAESGGA